MTRFILLSILFIQPFTTRADVVGRYIGFYINSTAPSNYSLDVDFDGNNDFFFRVDIGPYTYVSRPSSNTNAWLQSAPFSPMPFSNGQGLGSNSYSTSQDGNLSTFEGLGDRYLMVRFTRNGATHYGWILIEVSNTGGSATIRECAWETTPNQTILPGQQPVSISTTYPVEQLSCIGVGNGIHISGIPTTSRMELQVYDATGRTILVKHEVGNGVVAIHAAPGTYYAVLSSDKRSGRKTFKLNLL